jgi:hypothetical protein
MWRCHPHNPLFFFRKFAFSTIIGEELALALASWLICFE